MPKLIDVFKAMFIVAGRAEYLLADVIPYWMGVALASLSFEIILDNASIVGIGFCIILLIHYATVWINCVYDYEMDKKYKSRLSHAVDMVGRDMLLSFSILFILIATLLVTHISMILGRLYLLGLWFTGVITGQLYSASPLRLKRYIIVGDLARGYPLICLLLFGYLIITPVIQPSFIAFLIGHIIMLFGAFSIAEIWDWSDDLEAGIHTIATIWGFAIAGFLGLMLITVGSFFVIASLCALLLEKGFTMFSICLLLLIVTHIIPIYECILITRNVDKDYFTTLKPLAQHHQYWLCLWYLSELGVLIVLCL